jgi:hypothetical protein
MLKPLSRKPVVAAMLAAGLATAGLPATASTIQERVTVSAGHGVFVQDEGAISAAAAGAPLTSAQDSLWRASRDYALNDMPLTKADLDQAVKALARAAQSGDETTRREVGKLLAQVRDLHVRLAKHDKDFDWRAQYAWRRAKALSDRAADYVSTGWERFRSKDEHKKHFIEAKRYLGYAYADHYVARDDAAARVELAQADGYLGAASARGDAAIQDDVKQISVDLHALMHGLDDPQQTQAVASHFETAQSELGKLIRNL